MNRSSGVTATIAATILCLTLTACSTPTQTASVASPPSNAANIVNSPTPDTVNEVTPEPESTTKEAPTDIRLGDTWSWEDGTAVTVSVPKSFTPGQYAYSDSTFNDYVKFTITVRNGSDKKLSLISTPSVSSGDEEGAEVFDSEKGLDGPPSTAILPGRKIKFEVGYGVKDPKDIVMQYSPTFEHEDAIFTSK